MTKVEELRAYEAKTLRVRWNYISQAASSKAGTLNWDAAPASAWNRPDTTSYAYMAQLWFNHSSQALEELDPTGTSDDSALTSLRRGMDFHASKVAHLQRLGISQAEVPSATAAAIKAGFSGLFTTVLPGVGNVALDVGGTALKTGKDIAEAAGAGAKNVAKVAGIGLLLLIVVAGIVAVAVLGGKGGKKS
jgi:hypothetical protein